MFLALALFTLTSCVKGWSQLEAAEGANITLRWESGGSISPTGVILYCFHKASKHGSAKYRLVLEVSEGTQRLGSTQSQFYGRVLWDRGVLSLGQVQIVLTRITARDQGSYWCYMYANYHPPSNRWTRVTSEYFNLTVTSDNETEEDAFSPEDMVTNSYDSSSRAGTKGDYNPELGLFQMSVLCVMFACMTLMALGIVLAWLYHQCVKRTKKRFTLV